MNNLLELSKEQKLLLCLQMFDMDGDGKISLNDLLKYTFRLHETDIYLKNDVVKLIKVFENNSAIDIPKSRNLPFLTANYKSKLFGFTQNYTIREYNSSDDGINKGDIKLPKLSTKHLVTTGRTPNLRNGKLFAVKLYRNEVD